MDNKNYRFKAKCQLNYSLGISFESWLTLFTIVPHGIISAEALPCHYVTKILLWITVTIALTRFTSFSSGGITKRSRDAELTMRTLSKVYDKMKMQ